MEVDPRGAELTRPMVVVVDSSVFVASLSPIDSTHVVSRSFLSKLDTQEVLLPTLVIAEVAIVLYRNGYKEIPTVVRNVSSFPLMPLDREFINLMVAGLPNMPPLKTADMIIVSTAKEAQATLVTWDKQLLRLPASICKITTPEAFLNQQQN